jgi:hypothetical protein
MAWPSLREKSKRKKNTLCFTGGGTLGAGGACNHFKKKISEGSATTL